MSGAAVAYEKNKSRARSRARALTLAGQDIAPCPPPQNPDRRSLAWDDFRYFCETYFPMLFPLAWSNDHLRVIAKIERVVKNFECFAVAMPRGSGKSTLCEVAAIWAILTGRHRFVFLIASSDDYAEIMISNIKSHLMTNDLLLADFPEAIYPIRKLEGESRRCSGQRYYGVRTRIGWGESEIVMPTIPGSQCSGAIVRVSGITGNIRGARFVLPDGRVIRPSLAIVDDPQTDASARSVTQTRDRVSVVKGAISGLAGPGKRVAMIMPCTVIRPDDLADQMLDREKNPLWQGERTKMIYAFPKNEKLWEEYARMRDESFRCDGDGREATEFYRQRFDLMNEGAEIAWPARFDRDVELSAIQNAMNLLYKDRNAFFAEYQNDPIPDANNADDEGLLSAEEIAAKTNGMKRGEVPLGCNHLTMFIDVQGKLLYWAICAFENDFTGYVVDYGAYPDPRRPYFTLREAQKTIITEAKGAGIEAAIYAALDTLTDKYLGREFERDDGAPMKISKCVIDANWGISTNVVYQFCRQSKHAALLMPSHGKYVGASSKPFSEYSQAKGDRAGLHWRIPATRGKQTVRHLLIDANYWKSFVHARLAVKMGDPGCLSFFGRERETHVLIADHLTAEFRVKTAGRGRVVDEWKIKPGAGDNHWLDCLVGCAASASLLGAHVGEKIVTAPRKKLKLSELQKSRQKV